MLNQDPSTIVKEPLDVAAWRSALGLTQTELAVAADVAINTVVKVEKLRSCTAKTRRKIETALRRIAKEKGKQDD